MSSTDPDIVLGTESWLKPEILNCEVFPEEYTVYWKDRDIRHKLKGGGVFILVRIFFTSCEIEIDTVCRFEACGSTECKDWLSLQTTVVR